MTTLVAQDPSGDPQQLPVVGNATATPLSGRQFIAIFIPARPDRRLAILERGFQFVQLIRFVQAEGVLRSFGSRIANPPVDILHGLCLSSLSTNPRSIGSQSPVKISHGENVADVRHVRCASQRGVETGQPDQGC